MKIIEFVKYLILPITILCSDSYSSATNNIHSDDYFVRHKYFGNMQVLITDPDDYDFPDSIIRCYSKPANTGDFFVVVKQELGNPNSKDVKVRIRNERFEIDSPYGLKPGIAKYNDKYYLMFYQVLESTNEYLWCYLDKDAYYVLLGKTPRNNSDDKHNLLEQGQILITDEDHYDFPSVSMRCYVRSNQGVKTTIQVHKEMDKQTSELINVHLNNGNIVLDNNYNKLIPIDSKFGIIRFNDDYYLAFYELTENGNEYEWYYLDEDGYYCALGETLAF